MAYIYPARTLKPAFSFLFWDWLIKVVLKNTIVSVPCAVSSKHNILNIKRSTHAKTIMQITWDGRGKMNRGVELSSSLRQSKAGLDWNKNSPNLWLLWGRRRSSGPREE